MPLSPKLRVVVAVAVMVAMGFVVFKVSPGLGEAQRAHSLRGLDRGEVRLGAWIDFVFMAAYAMAGWAAFSLFPDPKHAGFRHPTASAGILLGLGGALADAAENVFLLVALSGDDGGGYLAPMRSAGLVKWALLGTAALTLVSLVLRRSAWNATPVGRPSDRPGPPPATGEVHPWEPPRKRAKPRVGVCLSGGGIRSAAFCLGGMQALREREKLDDARYLAAVSGGGYLAAGWAVSDAAPPSDPPRWGPGSPEERWFRDHASYLVPDLKGGASGLFRMLGGVVVNLLLIGLVLFAASRPVGWAMYELHDSLRATTPTVLIRDGDGEMQVGEIDELGSVDNDGAQPPITRFAVHLVGKEGDAKANQACFDRPPYEPGDRDVCVDVKEQDGGAAVVEVQSGRAKVVTQPKVEAVDRGNIDASISRQPTLALDDDLVVDGAKPGAHQFKIERQPKVGVKTGLGAVTYPKYPWWMWEFVGGLLTAAALVGLTVMSLRSRDRRADVARGLARVLAGAGAVAFLVMIGLPWLVVWLPRTLTSLVQQGTKSASGSGFQDYLLPSGGMLALIAAAAGQYLAGSKGKTGGGTGEKKSLFSKVWGALSKKSAELKWYELSPSKILVAVLSFVGVVVAFVNLLQFAAANGIKGRLMGFAFIRDSLPDWLFLHDGVKFAIVVALLALFGWFADAQAWSLYPFYKTRLSSAYLLQRTDPDHAEPIPFKMLLPFSKLKKPDDGPQLIACCAVNLNEYGVVPPGRRAASFTFSSTEIGGPLVGYATPEDYEKLPFSRQRDVTVSSAMAISGAAFSPAMGKFNLGPVGSLLALANLRLGVWIPHPCRVRDGDATSEWDWRRFRRPHWWWFLRELSNTYAFHRRYVYVSDGGHWDNLGLVELLRRGCTEIYCISGAGDGALSFGTIGEAIALAREELGVEITLDPSPLRAPAVPSTPSTPLSPRELRREGAKDKAGPFARASAVKGTFRFTRSDGAAEGVIYYVEADLSADMPFDVHTFAESEPVFPDDSTGDQVFGHRQFESYRALGYHQAVAACELP